MKSKKEKRQRGFQEGLPVAPLLTPAALVTSFMFLVPILVFFRFSFNQYVPGKFMETAWTLENYREFFTDPYYYHILGRTLKIAFFATLATLILAFPVASCMAKARGKWKSFFVISLVFPMMLGSVIRGMGWMGLFSESGLVNNTLMDIGILKQPLELLYTENSVIFAIVSIELPLMILTLETILESIHPDIESAAYNLGASGWKVFFKIRLPLAIPGILAGTSLIFVQSMNTYSTARMVGGPKIQMMATSIYSEITELSNWPGGAAMAFVLLVITLGITFLYSHVLEKKYIQAMHL